MTEQQIQQEIRLALGRGDVRVFRNNTGALRDENGRLVRYGLCTGSADLIGLRRVVIGPEHVGQTMGQFVAVEVKTATGRLTREQQAFLRLVEQFGGLAGVARNVEEAVRLVERPP